jgi:hypothetical protein
MATLEEFEAQELEAINNGDTLFKVVNGVKREFTEEDKVSLSKIRAAEKFDLQENGWLYARQAQYASIVDQLDMQYWDTVNGTTTWKDHIAKVKSDNPKPA